MSLKTCYHLFGVECGDGWSDIIKEAMALLNDHNEQLERPIEITQIKEKFGRLRIYLSASDEVTDKIIKEAYAKCAVTCEQCGEPGTLTEIGYWLQTLCPKCYGIKDDRWNSGN